MFSRCISALTPMRSFVAAVPLVETSQEAFLTLRPTQSSKGTGDRNDKQRALIRYMVHCSRYLRIRKSETKGQATRIQDIIQQCKQEISAVWVSSKEFAGNDTEVRQKDARHKRDTNRASYSEVQLTQTVYTQAMIQQGRETVPKHRTHDSRVRGKKMLGHI